MAIYQQLTHPIRFAGVPQARLLGHRFPDPRVGGSIMLVQPWPGRLSRMCSLGEGRIPLTCARPGQLTDPFLASLR